MTRFAAAVVTEEGSLAISCEEIPSTGVCPNAPEGATCACAGMTLYVKAGSSVAGHQGWQFKVAPGITTCPLWALSSFPQLSTV